MSRLSLIVAIALCLLGACDGPTEVDTPVSESPEAVTPSLCSAAAAYLQACGAPESPLFEAECTDELADALLEMGCGELPEALADGVRR